MRLLRLDRDVLGLVHEAPDERLDGRGDGGREERRLPIAGAAAQDAAHVGLEADVEHAVGLVEDGHAHLAQVERAAPQVVDDAPRRADDDLRPALQVVEVLVQAAAAHQRDGQQAHRGGEELQHAEDLLREFARGHQHDGLHVAQAGVEPLDDQQAEGERLAGAGLRLPDDVVAVEHQRQALFLDRGGRVEAQRRHHGQGAVAEAEFAEGRGVVGGVDRVDDVERRQLIAARAQRLARRRRGAIAVGRVGSGEGGLAVSCRAPAATGAIVAGAVVAGAIVTGAVVAGAIVAGTVVTGAVVATAIVAAPVVTGAVVAAAIVAAPVVTGAVVAGCRRPGSGRPADRPRRARSDAVRRDGGASDGDRRRRRRRGRPMVLRAGGPERRTQSVGVGRWPRPVRGGRRGRGRRVCGSVGRVVPKFLLTDMVAAPLLVRQCLWSSGAAARSVCRIASFQVHRSTSLRSRVSATTRSGGRRLPR